MRAMNSKRRMLAPVACAAGAILAILSPCGAEARADAVVDPTAAGVAEVTTVAQGEIVRVPLHQPLSQVTGVAIEQKGTDRAITAEIEGFDTPVRVVADAGAQAVAVFPALLLGDAKIAVITQTRDARIARLTFRLHIGPPAIRPLSITLQRSSGDVRGGVGQTVQLTPTVVLPAAVHKTIVIRGGMAFTTDQAPVDPAFKVDQAGHLTLLRPGHGKVRVHLGRFFGEVRVVSEDAAAYALATAQEELCEQLEGLRILLAANRRLSVDMSASQKAALQACADKAKTEDNEWARHFVPPKERTDLIRAPAAPAIHMGEEISLPILAPIDELQAVFVNLRPTCPNTGPRVEYPSSTLPARLEDAGASHAKLIFPAVALGKACLNADVFLKDRSRQRAQFRLEILPPAVPPLLFGVDDLTRAAPYRRVVNVGSFIVARPFARFASWADGDILFRSRLPLALEQSGPNPVIKPDGDMQFTALRPGTATISAQLGAAQASLTILVAPRAEP